MCFDTKNSKWESQISKPHMPLNENIKGISARN